MNTTYDDIRDKFLSQITDFDLISLTEEEINKIVDGYMDSAIARFSDCTKDLDDRDETNRTFNVKLTSLEREILARYMLLVWLSPQTMHQSKLNTTLGTSDYKTYSPANQLAQLINLENRTKNDVIELSNEYYFRSLIDGDD